MSKPLPLNSFYNTYFTCPFYNPSTQLPLTSKEWKTFSMLMPYKLTDTSGINKRLVCLPSAENGTYSINSELAIMLQNIKLNVYKEYPKAADSLLGYISSVNNLNDIDWEQINPNYFNSGTRLIIAVGKFFSLVQKSLFIMKYTPINPDIDSVIQSIEGRIVDIIKVNWDGEPGSTQQYTLPDILILPGQSLWFFALYDYKTFDKELTDSAFSVTEGSVNLQINASYNSSTIDAKTIQGYPFPTIDSNQEWNWPGKNN